MRAQRRKADYERRSLPVEHWNDLVQSRYSGSLHIWVNSFSPPDVPPNITFKLQGWKDPEQNDAYSEQSFYHEPDYEPDDAVIGITSLETRHA